VQYDSEMNAVCLLSPPPPPTSPSQNATTNESISSENKSPSKQNNNINENNNSNNPFSPSRYVHPPMSPPAPPPPPTDMISILRARQALHADMQKIDAVLSNSRIPELHQSQQQKPAGAVQNENPSSFSFSSSPFSAPRNNFAFSPSTTAILTTSSSSSSQLQKQQQQPVSAAESRLRNLESEVDEMRLRHQQQREDYARAEHVRKIRRSAQNLLDACESGVTPVSELHRMRKALENVGVQLDEVCRGLQEPASEGEFSSSTSNGILQTQLSALQEKIKTGLESLNNTGTRSVPPPPSSLSSSTSNSTSVYPSYFLHRQQWNHEANVKANQEAIDEVLGEYRRKN
jgi:hypothetical protein